MYFCIVGSTYIASNVLWIPFTVSRVSCVTVSLRHKQDRINFTKNSVPPFLFINPGWSVRFIVTTLNYRASTKAKLVGKKDMHYGEHIHNVFLWAPFCISCLRAQISEKAFFCLAIGGKLADFLHSECEHIGFLVEFSPKQNDFVIVSSMEPKT